MVKQERGFYMQLSWVLHEKEGLSPKIGVVTSLLIGLVALALALVTFKSDIIISLLLLVGASLSCGVAYTINSLRKEKNRNYVKAIKLSFKEGYFIYDHPEYILLFSPSAIKKVKQTKGKKLTTVVFELEVEDVEVIGAVDIKGTLMLHMLESEYERFKTFYTHSTES